MPSRSQDLRVKATFRVSYESMDQLVVAYSKDLSRGGMFLATESLLPRGTVIRLNISLPDGGPEVSVTGNVIFVRQAEESEGRSAGMGVKFIDPDGAVRRRLEWFIVNSAPLPGQFGAGPRARKLDILIAEDDRLQSEAASAPFLERGDSVRVCSDGLDALAACLKQRPDVILCDVQMPRMDGWQLLRMVRSRPALTTVPFVFLTTLAGEDERLRGYRLGVDDYIPKPFQPPELLARVERAVVRSEHQSRGLDPADPDVLRGDLQQVGLASVLSFLELEKRTGVLRVGPNVNGRIWVVEGRPRRVVVDGASNAVSSRQLLMELLDLTVGRFDFRPEQVETPDEIELATSALLLEHARRRDEQAQS